jgi:endonuclease-3 related protein
VGGQTINEILLNIYHRLLTRYGPQHWWPAQEPFEVIIGAILTQSTAWTNVDKAIENLKEAGKLSPEKLRRLPDEELAGLIHPCGYYNVKTRRLKAFAHWFGEEYGDDLDSLFAQAIDPLRRQLLGIYGIGDETADSIMLYAGNKPVFVIDAYTRRFIKRAGLAPEVDSYSAYQSLFMDNLPADVPLFNEYHALLVRLGKEACRTRPLCRDCCLNNGEKDTPGGRFPCSAISNKLSKR